MRMNKQAFTLIEMLTVVLIIGILTAVALPQYRRAIQKAEAAEAVAMLRVIHDSGERLAAEFGYRSLNAMASSEDANKISFLRMDMFDPETLKCNIGASTIVCEHFTFNLNAGSNYISAVKRNSPYAGVEIQLTRDDLPKLQCTGNDDACELYNIGDD